MTSLEKKKSVFHSAQDDYLYLKSLMNKVRQDKTKESETIERYLNELVYMNTCKLNPKIPRQIVCLDEKYLRHCLEMIHACAAKSGAFEISFHQVPEKTGISLEGFVFPLCSLPTASENVNYIPPSNWIIGSINGSKSMRNILNSPMFHRLGILDDEKDNSNFDSPSGIRSNLCLQQKLPNDDVVLGDNTYRPSRHSRFDSMRGASASEKQLSRPGATVSHGKMQCKLTDGKPHYVFSMDEKSEVYEASLLSTKSSASEGVQWMYLFNLHDGSWKEGGAASTKILSQIGTMKVSTHFTICPNNLKILETEFVLYGHDEIRKDEPHLLSRSLRRNRGLSKKVVSTFKPNFSVMRRTNSAFWRTDSTHDSCPRPPPKDGKKLVGMTHMSETQIQPHREIAAIIIRRHAHIEPQEVPVAEPGGWGVNILKRVSVKEANHIQDPIISFTGHRQCSNEYCSATDIIIPAGYHSQPETGDGIPSSLVERWKTGGRCDCGGWDIGCPLQVYNTRPCKEAVSAHSNNQHECCSFDAVLKGTEKHQPQLKMVNTSSDLYYLDFQSSLSSLQCFSIALAVIHCQNTKLQSEMERQSVEITKNVDLCREAI